MRPCLQKLLTMEESSNLRPSMQTILWKHWKFGQGHCKYAYHWIRLSPHHHTSKPSAPLRRFKVFLGFCCDMFVQEKRSKRSAFTTSFLILFFGSFFHLLFWLRLLAKSQKSSGNRRKNNNSKKQLDRSQKDLLPGRFFWIYVVYKELKKTLA